MIKITTIIVLVFVCLSSTLLAQSDFLNDESNSYSAFVGYLKVEDYDPGTIVGFGVSSQKSVDVELITFKNGESGSLFDNSLFDFSFNIVKNRRAAQPINTAILLGLAKVGEIKTVMLGLSNSIYIDIYKFAFAPSFTIGLISGKDSNSNNISETRFEVHFPLCVNPENNSKIIIEQYFASVDECNASAFMVRLMLGGK